MSAVHFSNTPELTHFRTSSNFFLHLPVKVLAGLQVPQRRYEIFQRPDVIGFSKLLAFLGFFSESEEFFGSGTIDSITTPDDANSAETIEINIF